MKKNDGDIDMLHTGIHAPHDVVGSWAHLTMTLNLVLL